MSDELSPSGRYKLTVTAGGDHWKSRGVITRASDDTEIAVVERNYSHFPALWIEDHPRGDFLLCGEDYQGHTVIDLKTGARRDTLMEGTEPHGHGFCMIDARYHAEWQAVIVSGCIWACPYEYRLYDYSDPLGAGPELKTVSREGMDDDAWAEDDPHWPEFEGALVRFFQSPRAGNDEDSEDEEKAARAAAPPAAIKTFRREGDKLVFVSEETTTEETEKRRKHAEGLARHDAKMKAFRDSDPLYLLYVKLLEEGPFVPDSYSSHGITYHHDEKHTWCPTWRGDETRWCRRIQIAGRCIVDLEWAIETGPIKVITYVDHKSGVEVFFPHSTDGMEEAFAYAKSRIMEARQ